LEEDKWGKAFYCPLSKKAVHLLRWNLKLGYDIRHWIIEIIIPQISQKQFSVLLCLN